jgi:hypothetical protein
MNKEIPNRLINSYDIDGVIYMGETLNGVSPSEDDIIITGRSSFDERETTENLLKSRGFKNSLFMNPIPENQKTRKSSGKHKARTLFYLEQLGYRFGIHFEDDEIQAEEIRKLMPHINIVMLKHNLTKK